MKSGVRKIATIFILFMAILAGTKIYAQDLNYSIQVVELGQDTGKILFYGSPVYENGEYQVRLIPSGYGPKAVQTLYFTILDVQPDGQITKLFPTGSTNQQDSVTINNWDTISPFSLRVRFSPPFGKETLLAIFTTKRVDLNVAGKESAVNHISSEDIRWMLQGSPPASIQSYYGIYRFDLEIRSGKSQFSRKYGIRDWEEDGSDIQEPGLPPPSDIDWDSLFGDTDTLGTQTGDWGLGLSGTGQGGGGTGSGSGIGGIGGLGGYGRGTGGYGSGSDQRDRGTNIRDVWVNSAEKVIEVPDVQSLLQRSEIPGDKVFTVYPVLTFIDPNEPSYTEGITRGGRARVNNVTSRAYVVKGTITSLQKIKELRIVVQPQRVPERRHYVVTEFTSAPQSVFFEKQVELSPGYNSIDVTAYTDKGFAVQQKLTVMYAPSRTETEGQNYLLVMAVNNYQHWNKLKNPVADADSMVKILTRHYGFDSAHVIKLYNEDFTVKNVDSVFRSLITNLKTNDRLLVYYAGHGYYDDIVDEGYWIPIDGEVGNYSGSTYLSNSTINKYIKSLKIKHTLFITDACFSGSYFVTDSRGAQTYTSSLDAKRSRWLFTSGRMEEVADDYNGTGHSPFAYYILKYLQHPEQEEFTISDLSVFVTRSVANNSSQTPIARPIQNAGDEGGEFVFKYR